MLVFAVLVTVVQADPTIDDGLDSLGITSPEVRRFVKEYVQLEHNSETAWCATGLRFIEVAPSQWKVDCWHDVCHSFWARDLFPQDFIDYVNLTTTLRHSGGPRKGKRFILLDNVATKLGYTLCSCDQGFRRDIEIPQPGESSPCS